MKNFISIMTIFVFGFSGTVYAHVQKNTVEPSQHKTEVFEGSIVSVNAADSELIVKDLNNEEVTVTIDAATKISVMGNRARLSNLKKGKNVTVHCRVSGTDVIAQEIKYI